MNDAELFRQGSNLFGRRRMREAIEIAHRLIQKDVASGYLLAGNVYEFGGDGIEPDLDKALCAYETALIRGRFAGAQLGAVRVLLRKGGRQNVAKATDYCEKLLTVSNQPIDYLTLGKIYEKHSDPTDIQKAKQLYLQSGFKGLASGFNEYARIQYTYQSKPYGVFLYFLAAIVSPIMKIFIGKKTFRTE